MKRPATWYTVLDFVRTLAPELPEDPGLDEVKDTLRGLGHDPDTIQAADGTTHALSDLYEHASDQLLEGAVDLHFAKQGR